MLRSPPVVSTFVNRRVGIAIGVVVAGVFFGLVHFARNPWLIAYYRSIGLILALLAVFTDGIEVAIAVHVANNVGSGIVASLTSDMSGGIDRSVGTPWILVQPAVPGYLKAALTAGVRGFVPKAVSAAVLARVIRSINDGGRYVDPELAAEAIGAGDSPLSPREADVLGSGSRGLTD